MRSCLTLAAVAALVTTSAMADIERTATINCAQGAICFHIWPALPTMPGWHQDADASLHFEANILVRDGQNFNDSAIVLTGNISDDTFEPSQPAAAQLDRFISNDAGRTRADNPDAVITEIEPLATADGRKLRTFRITKLKDGHSQLISYTVDGDADGKFFVMLMLDAADDAGFEASQPIYKAMVAAYKHFAK